MSMTSCPACNGQVSEDAEACPHCGHPLKETTKEYLRRVWLYTGVCGLILGGIMLLVMWAAGLLR